MTMPVAPGMPLEAIRKVQAERMKLQVEDINRHIARLQETKVKLVALQAKYLKGA